MQENNNSWTMAVSSSSEYKATIKVKRSCRVINVKRQ